MTLNRLLRGKSLTVLQVAGCHHLNIHHVLGNRALRGLVYLDATGTAVRSRVGFGATKAFLAQLDKLPQLQYLEISRGWPASERPTVNAQIQRWVDGNRFQLLEPGAMLWGPEQKRVLATIEAKPPEEQLRALAALPTDFGAVGPFDRPVSRSCIDLQRDGAAYLLAEIEAMRAQGHDVKVRKWSIGTKKVPGFSALHQNRAAFVTEDGRLFVASPIPYGSPAKPQSLPLADAVRKHGWEYGAWARDWRAASQIFPFTGSSIDSCVDTF